MRTKAQTPKQTKFKITKIVAFACLLFVFSCEKPEITIEQITEESSIPVIKQGSELILGKKLNNPFSTANMIIAQKTLIRNQNSNSVIDRVLKKKTAELQTTHLYVKFYPNSEEHVKSMEDLIIGREVVIRHHPMDHEIVQYSENYTDPETTDKKYSVFYAAIPVDFVVPNIPYKVLEELHLPDKNSDYGIILRATSSYLTGNIDPEIMKQIEQTPQLAKSKKAGKFASISVSLLNLLIGITYTPKGTIKVYDTNSSSYVPYKSASIEIYTWFSSAYGWTDANGYFVSPEWFILGVGIYATWRNPTATIRTSVIEILGLFVTYKLMGLSRSNNNRTKNISKSNLHHWRKATTHLAFEKFNAYLTEKGITTKVKGVNVWVLGSSTNHRGSTPMLKKYRWAVSNNIYFTSWFTWFTPITLTWGNVLTALFGHLYPDMTLTYRYNTTRAIDALVFHESAHFIHATKAGSGFWSILVRREVDNIINHGGNPYYNGTTPSLFSGQLIALVEGYAKFMEHRVMVDTYNTAHGFTQSITTDIIQKYGNRLENFDMRNVPYDNAYVNYSGATYSSTGWGLSGLFWDLYDTNDDLVRRYNGDNDEPNLNLGRAVENVEGNQKAIFDLLTGSVNTGNDLKSAVKRKYPQISSRINHLFSLYGY